MHHKIGLFYGSTTGNTEDVANLVAEKLGHESVILHDIAAEGIAAMPEYQTMIMGIPTWDFGEWQEDWEELQDELKSLNLTGCQCALFGLGDQIGYGEWFVDAMGHLHSLLLSRGATLHGYWPVEGYNFEDSKALTEDKKFFVGLAIDEDCQHAETEERVEQWCEQLLTEFN